MFFLACVVAPLLFPGATTTLHNGGFTGVNSTFPKFKPLPLALTISSVVDQGYILQTDCSSTTDEYGVIYSKEESRFLPGLIYNRHGQLSGMVFGVNRTDLFKQDEVSLEAENVTIKLVIYNVSHVFLLKIIQTNTAIF